MHENIYNQEYDLDSEVLVAIDNYHSKFIRIYPSTLYYLSLLSIVLYISSLGNVPNSMRCCLKMSKRR